MKFGIERFLEVWISEDKYKLEIIKNDNCSAFVSIYAPDSNPIQRSYFSNKPTLKMPALYEDYMSDFRVNLWKNGKGYELHLVYEEVYELNDNQESLIPAITRYLDDDYLDQYAKLFGNLIHFTKQ